MRHSTYSERRKQQRRPLFLQGMISFAGRRRLNSMVQNLADFSAKLAFHTVTDAPAEFTLRVLLVGREVQYLARPKWRRHRLCGVQFVKPHPAHNVVSFRSLYHS